MSHVAIMVAVLTLGLGQLCHAQQVSVAELPGQSPAQIVILGEIHDNPVHHLHQAELVARWKPAAVVFEMITAAQAKSAQSVDRNDAAAMALALQWAGSGWPDYAMYHPVFAGSGAAQLYGAAMIRADVRRAIDEGAAAVFGAQAADYGLVEPLADSEQSAREADQMTAHCNGLPPEMLAGMVEAQRLRDAAFARTALAALRKTGGPVVVITGSGHADTVRGIPAALAVAAPNVTVFSIGQVEGDPGANPPFDRWIVTSPMARGDPCAAFAKP